MLHAGWQEAAAVHRRRRGCTTSGSALPTVICSGASTARLARPRPKSCIATGGERISAGRTALLPCSASEAERANSAITRGNPQLNQERKRTLPSSLILRRLSSAAPLASATRCPGAVRWKCPAPVHRCNSSADLEAGAVEACREEHFGFSGRRWARAGLTCRMTRS